MAVNYKDTSIMAQARGLRHTERKGGALDCGARSILNII